jgi:Xaa-Pro aminopeptidase
MDAAARFKERRRKLAKSMGKPILLMGNGHRARNLPMSPLPFRQDSTFLYFSGCDHPKAAMHILPDGDTTLFLPTPTADDPLWHGPTPGFEETRVEYGMENVMGIESLDDYPLGTDVVSLAVPDENQNRYLHNRLQRPFQFGVEYGDPQLVSQVIEMRRSKDPWEVQQMRLAAAASAKAHRAVMRATRPDTTEYELAALFRAVLAANQCALGYSTILTVHGEVLHNFHHSNRLKSGQLLLLDGGGEVASGYGVDITRTYPVSGKFTARQRSVYEAILEAQLQAIDMCDPGVSYQKVHRTACLVIAQFLCDEGVLRCSPETAVELGAHALVFPHGTGHHLGMDVHDLENFGDLSSYEPHQKRSSQFGTCYLRLGLPLESGWVVTVEPGFYIVDPILDDPKLRAEFSSVVDFDRLDAWRGFGGIRIEDDILITENKPTVLTSDIPKTISELEEEVGQGPSVSERLG